MDRVDAILISVLWLRETGTLKISVSLIQCVDSEDQKMANINKYYLLREVMAFLLTVTR
jgi:hypothetical protein